MLVKVEELRGGYGKEDVVKGVSFALDSGEILTVVGPNGSGKTTLFRLILGFIRSSGGSISIGGTLTENLSSRQLARLVAYIPQQHSPIFAYTALEIVTMGRASHFSRFDTPKAEDREAAFAAMEMLGIAHFANRKYTALSGGQRQLVLIARAICQQAKVFIMDEPGASLDFANHQLLMDVTSDLADSGYAIIMTTHSPEHAFSVGDKVMLMKDGMVAALGRPEEVVTPKLLYDVYGIEMDVIRATDRYGAAHTVCLPIRRPVDSQYKYDTGG